MKKICLVLSMLMVCSLAASAASTTYAFTFRDTAGNPYCDGMVLVLSKGAGPKTLVDGYHFNSDCAGNAMGVNGFKAGVAAAYQYNALGATMIVGDPVWQFVIGNQTNLTFQVNSTYHTWIIWASNFASGEYVVNFGTWVNGTRADSRGTKPSTKPQ